MNGALIWNSQSANKKSEEMKAMAANVLLENFSIISSRNQGSCFAWNLDLLLFLCGDNNIFCRVPLIFACILYSRCLHGTWKGKGEKTSKRWGAWQQDLSRCLSWSIVCNISLISNQLEDKCIQEDRKVKNWHNSNHNVLEAAFTPKFQTTESLCHLQHKQYHLNLSWDKINQHLTEAETILLVNLHVFMLESKQKFQKQKQVWKSVIFCWFFPCQVYSSKLLGSGHPTRDSCSALTTVLKARSPKVPVALRQPVRGRSSESRLLVVLGKWKWLCSTEYSSALVLLQNCTQLNLQNKAIFYKMNINIFHSVFTNSKSGVDHFFVPETSADQILMHFTLTLKLQFQLGFFCLYVLNIWLHVATLSTLSNFN